MNSTPTPKIMPDAWISTDREHLETVALRPFRSLALLLGANDGRGTAEIDTGDVGVVVQALVERAEAILGIPDETF